MAARNPRFNSPSGMRSLVLCILVLLAAKVKESECQNRGAGEDYLQVTESRQNWEGSWFTGSCECRQQNCDSNITSHNISPILNISCAYKDYKPNVIRTG